MMSTPDQLLTAQLQAMAERLARDGGRIDDAVAELRRMAAGRADLLAEAAGISGGYWTARVGFEMGFAPIGAGLLILAGADRDRLQQWVDIGRDRASTSMLRAREGATQ
jgi:hypothetical protein